MKKFYFLLCAMMVALAANATDYYLIGGFNGWTTSDASAKFTDAGDGTFTLDYQGTLTSGFKINDGTWSNDKVNFGSNGQKLVIGTPYNYGVGGSTGDIVMDSNIENPHIVLNPGEGTLLITGQSVEAEYCYGLHSNMTAGGEWATSDMTVDENGYWTVTLDIIPGEFGFKHMDAATKAQTAWIAAESATELNLQNISDPFAAVAGSSINFTSTLRGNFTFTFVPGEYPMFMVTPNGDPVVEYSYQLVTDIFTGEYARFDLTDEEGIYTYTGEAVQDGSIYVQRSNTSDPSDVKMYALNTTLADAGVITLIETEDDVITSTLKGTYKFMFNPETLAFGVEAAETPVPETMKVYFQNTNGWSVVKIHYWGGQEASSWPGVDMPQEANGIYSYVLPEGTTGIIFNDGSAQTDNLIPVNNHLYTPAGDQGEYQGELPVEMPAELYVVGTLSSGIWDTANAVAMTRGTDSFYVENLTVVAAEGGETGYITFITVPGADWDATNAGDRYGATAADAPLSVDAPAAFVKYAANVNASAAQSYAIAPDTYNVYVDFKNNVVSVVKSGSGIADVEVEAAQAVYYNLQGVEVANPTAGLYIEVRGNAVRKVVIR